MTRLEIALIVEKEQGINLSRRKALWNAGIGNISQHGNDQHMAQRDGPTGREKGRSTRRYATRDEAQRLHLRQSGGMQTAGAAMRNPWRCPS
jgi:hypothetical protein